MDRPSGLLGFSCTNILFYFQLVVSHGYEQYAAKKLKVAVYIGLISDTPPNFLCR
jgi:hypothetical protein